MQKPIEIIVNGGGTNPTAGTTDYINPALAGMDGYVIRSGYGPMPYASYQLLAGGGFRLLTATFGGDEEYFFVPLGLSYQTSSGNYTNGFNYVSVISALFNRMGWRQPTKAGYTGLVTGNNLTSNSGRYFDDFHAACTASNLKDVQEDSGIDTVTFNAYLDSVQRSVIMRCLNAVFSAPEYIDQVLLFERLGRQDYLIDSDGMFVGYRINVGKAFDLAVQIDSITLKFDQDVTFNLYLFADGKKTPVWIQSITAVGKEMTVVNFSDLVLNYISAAAKGTQFYLGYFQNDLGGVKAIRENIICWNKSLVFGAYPFKSAVVGGNDFDRNIIGYTDVNFGLNLEISSFKDWTQIIVKKPNLFDELIGLVMAQVVLEKIIYSIRSNANETLLKDGMSLASLIQDLTGVAPVSDGPPPVTGLTKRIEREIARVKAAVVGKEKPVSMDIGGNNLAYLDGPALSELNFLKQRGQYAGG